VVLLVSSATAYMSCFVPFPESVLPWLRPFCVYAWRGGMFISHCSSALSAVTSGPHVSSMPMTPRVASRASPRSARGATPSSVRTPLHSSEQVLHPTVPANQPTARCAPFAETFLWRLRLVNFDDNLVRWALRCDGIHCRFAKGRSMS
jgi:hypothetical protein